MYHTFPAPTGPTMAISRALWSQLKEILCNVGLPPVFKHIEVPIIIHKAFNIHEDHLYTEDPDYKSFATVRSTLTSPFSQAAVSPFTTTLGLSLGLCLSRHPLTPFPEQLTLGTGGPSGDEHLLQCIAWEESGRSLRSSSCTKDAQEVGLDLH